LPDAGELEGYATAFQPLLISDSQGWRIEKGRCPCSNRIIIAFARVAAVELTSSWREVPANRCE
jgi:hypothetical protein